jgi:hypothetical protein
MSPSRSPPGSREWSIPPLLRRPDRWRRYPEWPARMAAEALGGPARPRRAGPGRSFLAPPCPPADPGCSPVDRGRLLFDRRASWLRRAMVWPLVHPIPQRRAATRSPDRGRRRPFPPRSVRGFGMPATRTSPDWQASFPNLLLPRDRQHPRRRGFPRSQGPRRHPPARRPLPLGRPGRHPLRPLRPGERKPTPLPGARRSGAPRVFPSTESDRQRPRTIRLSSRWRLRVLERPRPHEEEPGRCRKGSPEHRLGRVPGPVRRRRDPARTEMSRLTREEQTTPAAPERTTRLPLEDRS